MTPSLAEARALVFDLLDASPLDSVDAVYDHEAPAETTGPCWVTVAFARTTPTEIVEAVRIYSQLADSPSAATERLEDAITSVDDRLKSAGFGPSVWDASLDDELDCLVARCFVDVPRETF